MKKILTALLLAFTFFGMARAQSSVYSNPGNHPYFGLRVSLDVEMPGKWINPVDKITMFRPGIGGYIGAVYNIPIVANLYIEPGAGLFMKRYSFKDLYIADVEPENSDKDPVIKKYGLRVPVMVGYRFDFSDQLSLALFTGPEFDWAFAGNYNYKNKNLPDDMKLGDLFGDDGYKRTGFAWNVGASVEVNYRYSFGITGSIGITDLKKDIIKFHENRLSITLGYNF